MKPIIRLAALTGAFALVAACSNPPSAAPSQGGGGSSAVPTTAATQQASPVSVPPPTSLIVEGTLTDCVDIEYPPMEFFPEGVTEPNEAIGFDVDAARAVAATLGLEIEIRNTAFDALIPDLAAGRCDIVWSGLYVNETRLKQADAVPYMATGQVVMVPAGNPTGIAQESDLCGKTISIQGGGLVEERANAASAACETAGSEPIDIQAYETVSDEFAAIVNGRVDAVWETDTGVLNFQFNHPGEYDVAYKMPVNDNYGVYYTKGKTDLGDALQAAIDVLNGDGTFASLATQYNIDPALLETVE